MKPTIIDASGHGRVVADITKKCVSNEIVFLDNDPNISTRAGYPVLGADSVVSQLEADLFIAVGNGQISKKLVERETVRSFPVLIHPSAVLVENVEIGDGSVVMTGDVINLGVKIGNGAIINICASVDRDSKTGIFVHVSIGAHTAGAVTSGENTWIGAGAVVINNINISPDCMIGAGTEVVKNISVSGTYFVVPERRQA